jgi:hypothetical protein
LQELDEFCTAHVTIDQVLLQLTKLRQHAPIDSILQLTAWTHGGDSTLNNRKDAL